MAELNARQLRFIEEYLMDWNATRAAIRAGYSPNTAYSVGYDLLRHPEIAIQIEKRKHEFTERCKITYEQIAMELAAMAFADVTQIVNIEDKESEVDPGRKFKAVTVQSLDQVPQNLRPAIASIKYGPHGIEIKLHDKNKAMEQLRKHLGMDIERSEISGPGGGPSQTEAITAMPDHQKHKLLQAAAARSAAKQKPVDLEAERHALD